MTPTIGERAEQPGAQRTPRTPPNARRQPGVLQQEGLEFSPFPRGKRWWENHTPTSESDRGSRLSPNEGRDIVEGRETRS